MPIPNNSETQRQVNAILAMKKLREEFDAKSDDEKKRLIELLNI